MTVANRSITVFTSSMDVCLANENRTDGLFISADIACKTCEPMFDPEEHADPADAAIPLISKLKMSISDPTKGGKDTLKTVYNESASSSPLI